AVSAPAATPAVTPPHDVTEALVAGAAEFRDVAAPTASGAVAAAPAPSTLVASASPPQTPVPSPASTVQQQSPSAGNLPIEAPPATLVPPLPEANDADLLTAVGNAPAPVTQKMIIASAWPPNTVGTPGETTMEISAAGIQTVAAVSSFLPQTTMVPAWQ